MNLVSAIGLLSGGLDSLLACRVIADQGIRVIAIKFVTPFFDYHLLTKSVEYKAEIREKYGIDVKLFDVSKDYLELLKKPDHGYGKHFNPCIDCKIFMLKRAKEMMPRFQASFLFTGEVIGQRPMSQRRDTLRVIERESGCEGFLLRPLCAKNLQETEVEKQGLVNRETLYGFSGRGRKQQQELARQFSMSDYPNPSGGCILTDPNLGKRIERFYKGYFPNVLDRFQVNDIRLLLVGRQFKLPDSSWFVLGRWHDENEKIINLRRSDDWLLKMIDRPGPVGLIRHAGQAAITSFDKENLLRYAGGLVVRYGKKIDGVITAADVCVEAGQETFIIRTEPLEDSVFSGWQV